jgi:diguanylate cyclase (GGDEF)-like protein/PAS domain S-box-containing protein
MDDQVSALEGLSPRQAMQHSLREWLNAARAACLARASPERFDTLLDELTAKLEAFPADFERWARHAEMLTRLAELQRGFLAGEQASRTFEHMLDYLLELTGSEYGFIGEVLQGAGKGSFLRMHGLSDIAWDEDSHGVLGLMRHGEFEYEFGNKANLLGEVLRSGSPVISNEPERDPHAKDLPQGHPVLRRFLGLPFFHGDELIGVLGLANAPSDYDQRLVDELAPVVATCSSLIAALRFDEERQSAQARLRESEQHFRTLANSGSTLVWTSDTTGRRFLEAVCRHLVEALDLDGACVGILSSDGKQLEVAAGWDEDGPLAARCCSLPMASKPQDTDEPDSDETNGIDLVASVFAGRGLRVCCTTLVLDPQGNRVGMLVAMSCQPRNDAITIRALMEVFHGRVSAEIQRERNQAAMSRRIAFERLVAEISSDLIMITPDELDASIDRALEAVGLFAQADRAYVFQTDKDGVLISNTHEWCAPGVTPQIDELQHQPLDQFPAIFEALRNGRLFDAADISSSATLSETERERLGCQGIRSILLAPMNVAGRLVGLIGLDAVKSRREWTDEARTLLTLVGNAFNSALQRKRAEARQQLAASVFTHANEGIIISNAEGRIIQVNKAFSRITGYDNDEVVGRHPHFLNAGRQDARFYADMAEDLERTGEWHGEVWNRRKNGEEYAESLTMSVLRDDLGRIRQYVSLFSDVTAQKAHEAQLEYIAHYDALTGLPNRVLLHDRLEHGMAQARRRGQQLAVAYIDLDGFKEINDTHGHQVGDQLLRALAIRMKAALREGDSISRLGGDEFVAVLFDLPDATAGTQLVQRLLTAVAQTVPVTGHDLKVSASIGVTLYPQHDDVDADQLLRQADLAMYQAKLTGKNRIHVFDTLHDRSQRGHHASIARVRAALGESELTLLYQPKVHLRSGRLVGVEALVRWDHPELGLLPPAAFLPGIEDSPVAVELGEWVIDQALSQMTVWHAQGLDLRVSVNIGASHLQHPAFIDRLHQLMRRHKPLARGRLELEVLETSALERMVQVSRIVESCAEFGVSFALDDFGTGYSSLSYLKRLPGAKLKIDQVFVRNMLEDPDDLAILEAILGLASAFGREVVAEGIESVEHGSLLLQLGCEYGQGFGIAGPMPAERLVEWAHCWTPPMQWSRQRRIDSEHMPLLYAAVGLRAWLRDLEPAASIEQITPRPARFQSQRLDQWLNAWPTHAAYRDIAQLHQALCDAFEAWSSEACFERQAAHDSLQAFRDVATRLQAAIADQLNPSE